MSFRKNVLILLLSIGVSFSGLYAQVWPGDVNNNGVVNGVDWLFVGSAIQSSGPPRSIAEQDIDWEEKIVTMPWGLEFPGTSIDLSFADCNGDGVVDFNDFEAVEENFELEHGIVEPDEPVIGEVGVDPQLFFDLSTLIDPFPQGFILGLSVNLGTDDIPIPSLSGISFTVNFDPDIVLAVGFIPAAPGESDWNFSDFVFDDPNYAEGRLSVAMTTAGSPPIQNGFGKLGEFFIVIEDDVVGMETQVTTEFKLENIFLLGPNTFDPLPIVGDTTNVTIIENPLSNENILDPQAFELFPNPVSDELYIRSEYKIERVEVYDATGQLGWSYSLEEDNQRTKKLDCTHWTPGIHFVKIYANEGIVTRKVLHD